MTIRKSPQQPLIIFTINNATSLLGHYFREVHRIIVSVKEYDDILIKFEARFLHYFTENNKDIVCTTVSI